MKFINSIISWVFKQRLNDVETFKHRPIETQQQVFHSLIQKGRDTVFGREHHFSSIQQVSDYQKQVPIRTYEQTFPYIQRIIKGEQNVLWPTKITWFAKSSGTTSGKSKFLPVSKETMEDCHFKGGKDAMALYCKNNPETQVFTGKSLIMGGSHQVNEHNKESKYGDVSAVMMQNMPLLGQFMQTPDMETALLDEWEHKLDRMVKITSKENVSDMAGVPTWTLVLLKKMLEYTGANDITEVWPNLELYIHGGVNFEPYREQFNRLIPSDTMQYYQMYNASEGFFAMQDSNEAKDMLLMLNYGIYYEFIPKEEFDKEQPKTVSLEDVEVGKLYALVISTNSGLWRYQLGDTIQFTSVNPYRIQVAGRTKSFINAFGEEVIVENADEAIAEACRKTNAILSEYTAAPIYFSNGKQAAHEWMIEFERRPNDGSLFKQTLDEHLQSINTDYQAKRYKDLALISPTIHFVEKGTFEQWLKQKGKLGGQNKVPRLKNDRSIITEIKEIASLGE